MLRDELLVILVLYDLVVHYLQVDMLFVYDLYSGFLLSQEEVLGCVLLLILWHGYGPILLEIFLSELFVLLFRPFLDILFPAVSQFILVVVQLGKALFSLVEDCFLGLQDGSALFESCDDVHVLSDLAFLY